MAAALAAAEQNLVIAAPLLDHKQSSALSLSRCGLLGSEQARKSSHYRSTGVKPVPLYTVNRNI